MLIGLLHPTPPYNFERTISAARFHTVLDQVRNGEYWRALRMGKSIALVRVVNRGSQAVPVLEVHMMNATGPVDKDSLLHKVRFMLGVDADLSLFYELARTDAVLWNIVEPLYGLSHVRAETIYEALTTTIIEQQITLSLAQRYERWLVQWGNCAIDYEGELFYLFPRPDQIANASLDELKPVKITTRRTLLLMSLAQQIASNAIDLEVLSRSPIADIYDTLTGLKGIGGWTAAWTIIRALGHYQYIGENDVALQAAVNHFFYDQSGKLTPQAVKETLGRYGNHAGTVAFYTLMRWAVDRYG